MNVVADGYVRKNFTLAPEVWTSIYAEDYVRSTSLFISPYIHAIITEKLKKEKKCTTE